MILPGSAGCPHDLDGDAHAVSQQVWGDGGYAGQLIAWVMLTFESRLRLEIVRRTEEQLSVVRHSG